MKSQPVHLLRRLVLILLAPSLAFGASLPSGLVPTEIENIVQTIGFGATTRLMRSAEAYPSWPGAKIGAEIVMAGTRDIASYGNQNGSVPPINLMPRLYIAKGLFSDLEIIFSILPLGTPSGIATTGAILKWTFYREKDGFLSVAAYYGYTSIRAYNNDYHGNNAEFGIEASKDFVRIRPYLGGGLLFAEGSVTPSLAKTAMFSTLQSTLHTFIGLEWELPINLSAQLDLMNLTPMGSFLIAKRF